MDQVSVVSGLLSYGVPALLSLGVLWILVYSLMKVASPVLFPRFLVWFSGLYNRAMDDFKRELFRDLHAIHGGASSETPRPLTLLEIGVGTGANFEYYPDGAEVIGIEPNKFFFPYLEKTAAKHSPRVRLQRTVMAYGENLREHVDDCSVDAVVITLVLCSVKDIDTMLAEAKRVLKQVRTCTTVKQHNGKSLLSLRIEN